MKCPFLKAESCHHLNFSTLQLFNLSTFQPLNLSTLQPRPKLSHAEVSFLISPLDPWRDILIAELMAAGYEGIEETTGGLRAYITSAAFDRKVLDGAMGMKDPHARITFTVREAAPRNWNEEWERSFQPIEIDGRVRIRAAFHEARPGFEHEIIITPRMAFGTGHHATTRLMIQAMMGLDLTDRVVCDLGCGTGVLAILAERLGASRVRAIDTDEQAVLNARDNLRLNNCQRVVVEKGNASSLGPLSCGAILANIERNTLMNDMHAMSDALLPGAALLLSGFVVDDRHMMVQCAKDHGLAVVERMNEGEWALVGCRK